MMINDGTVGESLRRGSRGGDDRHGADDGRGAAASADEEAAAARALLRRRSVDGQLPSRDGRRRMCHQPRRRRRQPAPVSR